MQGFRKIQEDLKEFKVIQKNSRGFRGNCKDSDGLRRVQKDSTGLMYSNRFVNIQRDSEGFNTILKD